MLCKFSASDRLFMNNKNSAQQQQCPSLGLDSPDLWSTACCPLQWKRVSLSLSLVLFVGGIEPKLFFSMAAQRERANKPDIRLWNGCCLISGLLTAYRSNSLPAPLPLSLPPPLLCTALRSTAGEAVLVVAIIIYLASH